MILKKLLKYLSQTVEGKLAISKLEKKFNSLYRHFDYNRIKFKFGDIADKLEEFNEDLSRYEPIDTLRNEYPDYYISDKELLDIIKRLKDQLTEYLK